MILRQQHSQYNNMKTVEEILKEISDKLSWDGLFSLYPIEWVWSEPLSSGFEKTITSVTDEERDEIYKDIKDSDDMNAVDYMIKFQGIKDDYAISKVCRCLGIDHGWPMEFIEYNYTEKDI